MVWLLKLGAVEVCSKSWDKRGASSWRGNHHTYSSLEIGGERIHFLNIKIIWIWYQVE